MSGNLDGLLYPKSVAMVGASATPGKINHTVFSNLGSFPGPVYAVNPRYRELAGRPCVASVSDLPEAVDLVVIMIPAAEAVAALEACGRKGIRNVAVISAGFRESGEEGARRERELVRVAEEHGLNVLGPNAFGIVSPRVGLNTTFARRGALPGELAFLSQSGAFGSAVLDWAGEEGLGFSFFVGLGNQAVLDESDFLLAAGKDPYTKVIAMYLEGVRDGARFLRAAQEVTPVKPVVVLKVGHGAAGARAAFSHTGTLAGAEWAYEAAFRRCGVIRARTAEELFDFAYVLARQPLPRGRGLGILSNAGGPGVIAADTAEEEGLEVVELSPATTEALARALPPMASLHNPVDILGDASAERYRETLDLVLSDPGVDMALALSAPHPILTFDHLAAIAAAASVKHGKPLAASFMAGELGEKAEGILREAGIPTYFDPARAVRSLAVLARYAAVRGRPPEGPRPLSVDRERATAILAWAQSAGKEILGLEALGLLSAYGIPVARGGLARTPAEAAELARDLGERVVLKVASPGLSHKSDVGGVRLGVPVGEVGEAARAMFEGIRRRFPEVPLEGIYVQELLPPGKEVILGAAWDPIFGPLVMFGLGGIHVEILRDVAFAVAPLSPREAEGLVRGIRGFPILAGVRGEPAVALGALAEVVERLGRLMADSPEIRELDVNPLLCYPDRVVAVDLRVALGRQAG